MGSIPEQEGDLQKAAPWAHQAVNFRIDLGDPEVLPPGASAEQLLQYNARQLELAAARASIMARFNLEEDVFGLVRSRSIIPTPISSDDLLRLSVAPSPHMEAAHVPALQDVTSGRPSLPVTSTPQMEPFRPPIPRPYLQGSTPRPLEPIIAVVDSPPRQIEHDKERESDAQERDREVRDNEGSAGRQELEERADTEPIISESNPKFRKFAKDLAQYQNSTLTNAHNVSRSSEVGRFRRSRQAAERSGALRSQHTQDFQKSGNLSSTKSGEEGIPDEENCALFLSLIHPSATAKDILSVVRTGKVRILHISPPDANHSTSAAKLVFMTHSAAARFLQQINSKEGVAILGQRIKAIYNRFGYIEYTRQERSRVILIQGPDAKFMTFDIWNEYFKDCVDFDLDTWEEEMPKNNKKILKFAFARLDAQAESAYHAIKKEPAFQGVVDVKYGTDPCDPSSGS